MTKDKVIITVDVIRTIDFRVDVEIPAYNTLEERNEYLTNLVDDLENGMHYEEGTGFINSQVVGFAGETKLITTDKDK